MLKRVSDSEQVVTLAAAKFVVNGEHVSIVDDGGRFLEALPLQVTQGEETVSYTYSLVNDREIEVRSSANARGSAPYKSWWKCTLGTVGGAVTGGLVGAAAGGSTGSVIPVAGTATVGGCWRRSYWCNRRRSHWCRRVLLIHPVNSPIKNIEKE